MKRKIDDIEAMRQHLADLQCELKSMAETVGALAGDAVGAAKGGANRVADRIGETAEDVYGQLSKDGRRYANAIETNMTEHPLGTMAIAIAVGMVIGRMFGSRSSR